MIEPSNIKINGINAFINRFNTKEQILDLDTLKTRFKLDEGDTGMYRLFLSQKIVLGEDRFTETYNRPPIGPLPSGAYCTYCGKEFGNQPDKLALHIRDIHEKSRGGTK